MSNTGAAQWTIPIEVPRGPGGFTPSIAIRYSSSRGDSPFGVGWDIELGEVSCSVRFGVPAYFNQASSPCPRFELDGELLNGAGGGRYHTFVESFQRIVHVTSGGSDHWEVTSPQGITRRYGSTADSRIFAPSGAIARWLLSEVVDPHGQSIRYAYDGDPLDADHDPAIEGFVYLRQVTYGTPEAEREVRFEYDPELRPDIVADFRGGIERRIAYRANEAVVRSGGILHSRWVLGYDLADLGEQPSAADYSTGRSRLAYVQRFGSDCTASNPLSCEGLPAQTFRYRDPSDLGAGGPGSQWAEALWQPPQLDGDRPLYDAPLEPRATRIGDVDGDGLPDVVESGDYGHTPRLHFNTGSDYEIRANDPYTSSIDEGLENLEFNAPVIEYTLVQDFDGGYAVCAVNIRTEPTPVTITGYGIGSIGGGGTTSVGYVFQWADWSIDWPQPPAVNPTHVKLLGNFELIDLDADGRADLVMSARLSGVHVTHDCVTEEELPEAVFVDDPSVLTVQVAYRNTGSGWVEDPSLVAGLPIFHMVGVDSTWAINHERGWDHDEAWHDCKGFIGPDWGYESSGAYSSVYPCITHANFDPRFTDLNGDGRLDLVIAVPDDPSRIIVADHYPMSTASNWETQGARYFDYDRAVTGTTSLAYLSQDDGSWQRAPSFDPPFRHTHLIHATFGYPGARTQDVGVRFVDLNRDGFTDITWTSPFHPSADWPDGWSYWYPTQQPPAGYATAARGALILPRFSGHLLERRMLPGGLSMGIKRRKYPLEFREDAVRLVREQGRSVADVARSLDVHVNTLHGWVKAEADGLAPAVKRRSPEQEELTRLKRELRRVKEERDILKKAAAFFASQPRGGSAS